MKTESFATFDATYYLGDVETAAAYLAAIAEESSNDPSMIAQALGDIARSRNKSELARKTGLTREGLYKSLSGTGNPSFATVSTVASALGMEVRFMPAG